MIRINVLSVVCSALTWSIFTSSCRGYTYVKGPTVDLSPCPGYYCGRQLIPHPVLLPGEVINDNSISNATLFIEQQQQQHETNVWSECGRCPRGYRANRSSACERCNEQLSFYDWLYLGFMALICLVVHWICIDITASHNSLKRGVLMVHLSALFETCVSAILTLVLTDPIGQLNIVGCRPRYLSDWYTLFYNPSPNYEEVIHCTQEAVYPLYNMVFLHYGLSIVMLLCIRPWLVPWVMPKCRMAIYSGLWIVPILSAIHAVFAGLLYHAFPYMIIVMSVVSNAAHFAFRLDQSAKALLMRTVTELDNVIIVGGQCVLQAYGIVAITQLSEPAIHLPMLALVLVPTLFYIATARFTDPNKLHLE